MKKAFTLIELLVVIAIIAILAAILFPVFAQAKTAAKKATSVSNQKQIGLAIIMYAENYDDLYPRQDGCTLNKSLNSKHNNLPGTADPTQYCSGGISFAFRDNHYSWQKWIQPYMKSVEVCFHPAMQKDAAQWDLHGEIFNGYGLNLALTGALNTWNASPTATGQIRTSFLGGLQTAVPDVAAAMLLFELASPSINFAPTFMDSSSGTVERRAYPPAIREMWRPYFYKQTAAPCTYGNELDNKKVPFAGTMNLSYTDGHTKSVSIGKFLADTPSANEYTVSSRWPCAPDGGAWTISAAPVWTRPWPMWALQ